MCEVHILFTYTAKLTLTSFTPCMFPPKSIQLSGTMQPFMCVNLMETNIERREENFYISQFTFHILTPTSALLARRFSRTSHLTKVARGKGKCE